MLISRRASYGLRTACKLAEAANQGRGATIAALAESEHLPRKFLEQVLRDLVQAGIMESKPGPRGGVWLARTADQITVGDIVRALDGELRPGHCVADGADHSDCPGCWGTETCAMRELWVRLHGTIEEVLDDVTLADLTRRQAELCRPPEGDYQI